MILVVGCGHVGLACAVALAAAGHSVVAVEVDAARRAALQAGRVPFGEPGLGEGLPDVTVTEVVEAGNASIVVLAVPTPADEDGPQLDALYDASARVAATATPGTLVLVKSTLPPGTVDHLQRTHPQLRWVSNPEFLRVGHALHDLRHPARIVLGGSAPDTRRAEALWRTVVGGSVPVVHTSATTAELAKLSANVMLAARVALVNELTELAVAVGADPGRMWDVVGMDARIGAAYLQPSPGFGGVCLPKDVHQLAHAARAAGAPSGLVEAAARANQARLADLVGALAARGPVVAVWGLGFRPRSADRRGSVVVAVVDALRALGREVRCWDPFDGGSVAAVTEGADAVFVGSDAPEDPAGLLPRSRWALDPAGLLDGPRWAAAGWRVSRAAHRVG